MNKCKIICVLTIVAEAAVLFCWLCIIFNDARAFQKVRKIQTRWDYCSKCVDERAKLWKPHEYFQTSETMEHHCNCEGDSLPTKSDKVSVNRNSSSYSYKNMNNCSWLREFLDNNLYNSEMEKNFPIAFTIVVHDSPEQILRLIRILYRRQNSFCIHTDAKSPYKRFFERVSNCVDNIVVPPNLTSVVWGHSSVLEAQMKCARELVNLRTQQDLKWKYLLNLCGKEIPLVTNREMVNVLRKLSGTSNIKPQVVLASENEFQNRFTYPVVISRNKSSVYFDKSKRLENPLFNSTQLHYKSSGYHALSFPFVHHLLYNYKAIRTRKLFQQCKSPEEHYYATVFMMPGVPGGYKPSKWKSYFRVINSFWVPPRKCFGKIIHRVCIVGAEDLSRVSKYSGGHFFHNKYFMEYDDTVMCCMEKKLMERNWEEFQMDCSSRCHMVDVFT